MSLLHDRSGSSLNNEGDGTSSVSLLLSAILEGTFLAIFLLTYSSGAWLIMRHGLSVRPQYKARSIMFAAGTVMLFLAVAHFSLDLYIVLKLYPDVHHVPSWYSSLGIAKFMIYVTQTLVGDGFVVYRLFVVWDRRQLAYVLPAILLLCDAVLGYSLPWLKMIPTPDFFVMSFLTNALCTILIMSRVLYLNNGTAINNLMRKVVEGIIQSAAIYSIASISLVITVLVSPDIGYVVCLNVFPAVIGLVFSFIVLRVGVKSKEEHSLPVTHSQTRHHHHMVTPLPLPVGAVGEQSSSYGLPRSGGQSDTGRAALPKGAIYPSELTPTNAVLPAAVTSSTLR